LSANKPNQRPSAARARERAAAMRAADRRSRRRRMTATWTAGAVVAVVIVGVLVAWGLSRGQPTRPGTNGAAANATTSVTDSATAAVTGPAGPEGIPLQQGTLLAPASSAATGATVDGISCDSNEQVAYHIHTHVAVYVNGALRPIPPGVGIVSPVAQQTANGPFYQASRCYYWLHVHAQDGIVHVEAPSEATYTLGQFFAIWRQPLSTTRVGPATGALHVWVDGKPYTGNPAAIVFRSHEDVQIDVGTPTVPPERVDWSHSQL
jgi:hypothetical protein